MSDATPSLTPALAPIDIQVSPRKRQTARRLGIALLSSAIPGTGHLLLARRRKGMLLLLAFIMLLFCFWPLRLLSSYAGFLMLYGTWLVLACYACCSSQLVQTTTAPVSRWWLVAALPAAVIIASLLGGAVTRASGFRSFSVPSTSMEPTIQRGDHIVVDTHLFRLRPPERQEILVFYREHTYFIKRIIGIPGDTIEGKGGTVLVNGHPLVESYIQHSRTQSLDLDGAINGGMYTFGPVIVPSGNYYVMGDNRDVSLDSRSSDFGFVAGTSIVGKALYVFNTSREGAIIR